MNYYIVVEGKRSEKKIYANWITQINSKLRQINNITDFSSDCFFIISGFGYPNYLDIINNSIQDMNRYPNIDFLVIAVDSENKTYDEKYAEIENFINNKINLKKVIIIIQHYCIETWALGNRIVIKRNPQDPILRSYLRFYNVRINDPELMESINKESMNRAQFTHVYLKKILNERFRNLSYTKCNPDIICHNKYLLQIIERMENTNQIKSFGAFYNSFKS